MKKRGLLIFAFLLFGIIFIVNSVSAVYCCEKTILDIDPNTVGNQGGMCQAVDNINLCDSAFGKAPTSCDETTYCQMGTCIDISSGTCSPTRKALCVSPARWVDADIEDIDTHPELNVCKEGCCIMGDTVTWGTEIQCNNIAYADGINTQFREDLSVAECFALDLIQGKGACTREVNFATTCTIETKEICVAIADATFHRGLLCSAPRISDCVMQKDPETRCENGKVYFTDSCSNLANVYDVNKVSDINYWTYIQEPTCSVTGKNNSCGNCNYRIGTTCSEYSSSPADSHAMPDAPALYGDNVCRDLSCNYNGVIYAYGESWCYESLGTFFHMPAIINETVRISTDIENGTYNIPGSEYYRLQCWDGEIIPYPCMPARTEICYESPIDLADSRDANGDGVISEAENIDTNSDGLIDAKDGGDTNTDGVYLTGTCRVNNWVECATIANSSECENPIRDCKWLHGYRYDGEIKKDFLGNPGDIPEDEQGSCVPLFSPGYDFWNGESDGVAFCASGLVSDAAFYELHWSTVRNVFEDAPMIDAAHRCLENCYSIPLYGAGITLQEVMNTYNGIDSLPGANGAYYLSLRRGHYCSPYSIGQELGLSEQVEGRALGIVTGPLPPRCLEKDAANRVIQPLFYTNEQWLNFLKNRTAALGDCGYKANAAGDAGQPAGEIITAVFENLNQQGEVKSNGTIQTIYSGDSYIQGIYRQGREIVLA